MKFKLKEVKMTKQGYMLYLEFFGTPMKMYQTMVYDPKTVEEARITFTFKASTREKAKDYVKALYPNATFFR